MGSPARTAIIFTAAISQGSRSRFRHRRLILHSQTALMTVPAPISGSTRTERPNMPSPSDAADPHRRKNSTHAKGTTQALAAPQHRNPFWLIPAASLPAVRRPLQRQGVAADAVVAVVGVRNGGSRGDGGNLADTDAIAEPLACLMSAAGKMMPVLPGDSIAVVGCGYMGLGMISLFRLCGYGEIIAIDKRPEALANAEKFGATRLFKADEVDIHYLLNWETMGRVDLTRDGDNGTLFALGVPNVMEFSGTADGLNLAGELVRSHGRLGIGGYHNDELRSVDFKLWNYKAITAINCHERRIDYEAGLCRRCLELLGSGRWNFTGVTNHIYEMEEFDRANEEMLVHRDGFIKGVVRC